jgi:hypothetical protein
VNGIMLVVESQDRVLYYGCKMRTVNSGGAQTTISVDPRVCLENEHPKKFIITQSLCDHMEGATLQRLHSSKKVKHYRSHGSINGPKRNLLPRRVKNASFPHNGAKRA